MTTATRPESGNPPAWTERRTSSTTRRDMVGYLAHHLAFIAGSEAAPAIARQRATQHGTTNTHAAQVWADVATLLQRQSDTLTQSEAQ